MNVVVVHVEWQGHTTEVGTAYFTSRRSVLTTRFVYADTWLRRADAWSISPDLPIHHGQATVAGLPGAFGDSAPDRWGRNLVERHHRAQHRREHGTLRTLTDVDFLVGVSDVTRQGALRYTSIDAPGEYLSPGREVPKTIALPTLLHAARQAITDDDDRAVKTLLDAGTGSLGGARPKVSVDDGGRLLLAKFPHPNDAWNVMAWEATALDLAGTCGITTPRHELVDVGDNPVLLLDRFDRTPAGRVPYISAMTLVGGADGEHRDYLDIAEAITDHGSTVRADLHELFRRIAFSIAINNVDDHLRNHGFLRRSNGWELAHVFDVNPNPDPGSERVTSIAGATSRDDGLTALVDSAEWFDLTRDAAATTVADVQHRVGAWRDVARRHGIADAEITRFATALDR